MNTESTDVVKLNADIAELRAKLERAKAALRNIEELTRGGKGQSMPNMIAQLALADLEEK